jgi:superfamily II DNA or RNA helicase
MYTQVITDYVGYLDDDGGFADFETQLYSDEERNQMIVNTVMQTLDVRKGIVFCKRVEHAEKLALKLRGL